MALRDYIFSRMIQAIPVLLSVIIINFLLVHAAPGDIATYFVGLHSPTPDQIAAVRAKYGLDKPLWIQFFTYMESIVRLDLGYSWSYGAPVINVISERIPATLLLTSTSLALSLVFGILGGALTARKPGKSIDVTASLLLLALYSTPVFWGGLILMLFFAVDLKLLPTSGVLGTESLVGFPYVVDLLRHLILPAATLCLFYLLGLYFRVTRSSVVEVSREDFVTTARAVGYDENTIFNKYVLRNALLPVVTLAGYEMGFLFSGALITETVFAWPGIGRLTYEAVLSRDFPLLMGSYLITSLCVIIASLATDVLYTLLDPRVKLE